MLEQACHPRTLEVQVSGLGDQGQPHCTDRLRPL